MGVGCRVSLDDEKKTADSKKKKNKSGDFRDYGAQ